MNLSEKIRHRFRDLPQKTWPVQVWRAIGVIAFVFTVLATIGCLITGHDRQAILFAAVALVDGSVVVSATRFIRDRKAGRPL